MSRRLYTSTTVNIPLPFSYPQRFEHFHILYKIAATKGKSKAVFLIHVKVALPDPSFRLATQRQTDLCLRL